MRPFFSWIDRRRNWPPPIGRLALAAAALCGLSGLPLLGFYRPGAPLASLARMMMLHPAGAWIRSVHFWSAQGFLICALLWLLGQLVRGGGGRIPVGAWLRLTLTAPVILFALWSGVILRGDPAAEQAADSLRYLLHLLPPGGGLPAWILLGPGPGLAVVCWHHGLTAGLVLAGLLWPHFRRLAADRRSWWWMLLPVGVLSVLWVPSLGAYAPQAGDVPWYLAGGREALRGIAEPGLIVGLAASAWLVLAALPLLARRLRAVVRAALGLALLAYAVLTAAGLARRPAPAIPPGLVSARALLPVAPARRGAAVADIAGRPEGCLSCHAGMSGFSPVHNPAAIGCTACHRGNPFTLDARVAHAGMILTPGNLTVVDRTCAAAGCHADIAAQVRGTLMNTMSGVVAVDKVVFGESRDWNQRYAVAALGHSPADRHLRNLCASCHLGQDKAEPAAIGEQTRGGGCSACHLDYGPDARAEMERRATTASAPTHHPEISTRVPGGACFGCHSRSGRISTNYEGWSETTLSPAAARQSPGWPQRFRVLDDGRVFTREPADVHGERGMSCTDCHLASEIMGDGRTPAHEAEAVRITCVDCHTDRPPATATFVELDAETQKIVALRQLNQAGRRFVRAGGSAIGYPNVFLDESGALTVVTAGGARLQPQPPAPACTRDIPGHARLECRTCHSAWAPQCLSCHTSFNPRENGWDHLAGHLVRGVWQETGGEYRAEPPVLGVERVRTAAGGNAERVATFVPGMVMTLNRSAADRGSDEFHRLYAPAAPHTIVTRGRDCVSCHANPLALGYGRGTLRYRIQGARGRWEFTPALPRGADGLPFDAWIGWLEDPRAPAATRTDVRPFNRGEQQRILLVGACLQCHAATEPRVAAVFAAFGGYRARLSPRCVLPDWAD